MIRDLSQTRGDEKATGNVCIIGAGIAGLVLAEKLRQHGVRVVILESGGEEQEAAIHALNQIETVDRVHLGATDGRYRGLGGTSIHWGGQLLPLMPHDLAERPHLGVPVWPVSWADLQMYLPEIERMFDVGHEPYDAGFLGHNSELSRFVPPSENDFVPRFAKWPIFRRRNLAVLLRDMIQSDMGLEIWLHATVTGFTIDREAGRLTSIQAKDLAGRQIEVTAPNFVVAAGTIESTRLLLALDRAADERVFGDCDALGRYFQDHFSAPVARLVPERLSRMNALFGPRFVGSIMRSMRLELSATAQREDRIASAFSHISFETEDSSGFSIIRDLLRKRQQHGGGFDLRAMRRAVTRMPDLLATGLWRYGRGLLRWPRDAIFHLQVDVEQLPNRDNRVELSTSSDLFGVPYVALTWRAGEAELGTYAAYTRRFDAFWRRRGLDQIAALDWVICPDRLDDRVLALARDVYHPTGSARMGSDRRSSVVDADLCAHAVPNLWVASAAVFPSSGSANPTLTLMLLARRLGDRLGRA